MSHLQVARNIQPVRRRDRLKLIAAPGRLCAVGSTPTIAAAERSGIRFRLHEYAHDPGAESYGLEAAEKLGVDPGRVFKTLVVSVQGGGLGVACIPVARQLDLKALGKRVELADRRRAEASTGYVTGGISPLGQRRPLPTHVDSSALEHETVFVSAGRRGLEIELAPADLVALTGATVHSIVA
jgi:Cys-tRNA(Pro)/Cys-tRNA(Cys) deacylase